MSIFKNLSQLSPTFKAVLTVSLIVATVVILNIGYLIFNIVRVIVNA